MNILHGKIKRLDGLNKKETALVQAMLDLDPAKRPSISQVRASHWYTDQLVKQVPTRSNFKAVPAYSSIPRFQDH